MYITEFLWFVPETLQINYTSIKTKYMLGTSLGEGNGNPLQYSCLENPVNRGAWWAAIYGVSQSQTRLK